MAGTWDDSHNPHNSLGWRLIAVIGWSLVIAGTIDLSLGLYPVQFGVPEWELGAISNLLDRLPLLGLGMTFLLSAGLARRTRFVVYLMACGLLFLAALVFVFGVLYATNWPLVLGATSGALRFGVMKGAAKTAIQTLAYFSCFGVVAVMAFRIPPRFDARA